MSNAEACFVSLLLLTLAWGTLAFGSVYSWAFTTLAAGCVLTGLVGLASGRRAFGQSGVILIGLVAVAMIGMLQLVPLKSSWLSTVSPATVQFLVGYDIRYLMAAGGPDGVAPAPWTHGISIDPAATWVALGLLIAFVILLAGSMRVLSRVSLPSLATGIVVLGGLLAAIGIVQYLVLGDHGFAGMKIYGFWKPEGLKTTPFGPYVNKNHFAGWMLMALPVGLALILREHEDAMPSLREHGLRGWLVWLSSPQGGRTMLLFLAVILMTLSLLLTRSRSGLAAFAAIGLLMTLVSARRFRSRRLGAWLGTAFAIFGVAMLTWASQMETVRGAMSASPLGMRLAIWQDAWSVFERFPFFGAGLNTFGTATILYQSSGAEHYNEAHNDYLQLLAEGGLLMAVVLVGIVIALIRIVRTQFRNNPELVTVYWLRAGAVVGLIAIALQSLVEFSLQMPGNAALFTVLLAMAAYAPRRSRLRA